MTYNVKDLAYFVISFISTAILIVLIRNAYSFNGFFVLMVGMFMIVVLMHILVMHMLNSKGLFRIAYALLAVVLLTFQLSLLLFVLVYVFAILAIDLVNEIKKIKKANK